MRFQIQHPTKKERLKIEDEDATCEDLQGLIFSMSGIAPANQILKRGMPPRAVRFTEDDLISKIFRNGETIVVSSNDAKANYEREKKRRMESFKLAIEKSKRSLTHCPKAHALSRPPAQFQPMKCTMCGETKEILRGCNKCRVHHLICGDCVDKTTREIDRMEREMTNPPPQQVEIEPLYEPEPVKVEPKPKPQPKREPKPKTKPTPTPDAPPRNSRTKTREGGAVTEQASKPNSVQATVEATEKKVAVEFDIGDRVELTGLKRGNYNGKQGTIVEEAKANRWRVELGDGTKVSIKEANLIKISRSDSPDIIFHEEASMAQEKRKWTRKEEKRIFKSAKHGDLDTLKELCDQAGAPLNCTPKGSQTPAFISSLYGNHECLEYLASKGANLNKKDKMGNTPAHAAACGGSESCLKILHKNGARLDRKNDDGETPHDIARKDGKKKCMRFLESIARSETFRMMADEGDSDLESSDSEEADLSTHNEKPPVVKKNAQPKRKEKPKRRERKEEAASVPKPKETTSVPKQKPKRHPPQETAPQKIQTDEFEILEEEEVAEIKRRQAKKHPTRQKGEKVNQETIDRCIAELINWAVPVDRIPHDKLMEILEGCNYDAMTVAQWFYRNAGDAPEEPRQAPRQARQPDPNQQARIEQQRREAEKRRREAEERRKQVEENRRKEQAAKNQAAKNQEPKKAVNKKPNASKLQDLFSKDEEEEEEGELCPDCDSVLKIVQTEKELIEIDDIFEDGYECEECGETNPTFPMWHCMKANCAYEVCINCKPIENEGEVDSAPAAKKAADSSKPKQTAPAAKGEPSTSAPKKVDSKPVVKKEATPVVKKVAEPAKVEGPGEVEECLCPDCDSVLTLVQTEKELIEIDDIFEDGYECEECGETNPTFPMWHCMKSNCAYEVCINCKPVNGEVDSAHAPKQPEPSKPKPAPAAKKAESSKPKQTAPPAKGEPSIAKSNPAPTPKPKKVVSKPVVKKEVSKPVVKKEAPPVVKKVAEPAKVEEPREFEGCLCPDCEKPITLYVNKEQLAKEDDNFEDGYECQECEEESPTWPMWHCKKDNCAVEVCTNCLPLPEGYVVPEAPKPKASSPAKLPEKIKVRPSMHRRLSDELAEAESGKASPRPDAGSAEGGIFSPRPGTQAKQPDYGSEEEVEAGEEEILTPPPMLHQGSRLDEEEQENWQDLKDGEVGDKVN